MAVPNFRFPLIVLWAWYRPISYNFYQRKTLVILTSFFSHYGQVNGKIMLTGVFRFCSSFFPVKVLWNGPKVSLLQARSQGTCYNESPLYKSFSCPVGLLNCIFVELVDQHIVQTKIHIEMFLKLFCHLDCFSHESKFETAMNWNCDIWITQEKTQSWICCLAFLSGEKKRDSFFDMLVDVSFEIEFLLENVQFISRSG